MIVSRNELAEALGISPAKVSALSNQGIFHTVARGKYDLTACIGQFIELSVEHLMKKKLNTVGTGDNDTLQYWKTQRQKHAALKEMGITMQVEQAEKLMSARLGQIRNVLIAIDSTWAPYMVGLKNVEQSQKMLSKQLDSLFEQLSSLQDFEIEAELPDTLDDESDDTSDDISDEDNADE